MPEATVPHFSKKVPGWSLIVLLLSAMLIGVITLNVKADPEEAKRTRLIVEESGSLEVKDPFAQTYVAAKQGQQLFMGALLKTGAEGVAELRLGDAAIRLAPDTELTYVASHLQNKVARGLVFDVTGGQLWISAAEPVLLRAPRAEIQFAFSSGYYGYRDAKSELVVFEGEALVTLLTEDRKILQALRVPLATSARFADSQLIAEYSRLAYSKLQKELRIRPFDRDGTESQWLKENWTKDRLLIASRQDGLDRHQRLLSLRTVKNKMAAWKDALILVPDKKKAAARDNIGNALQMALRQSEPAKAEAVLREAASRADTGEDLTQHLKDLFYRLHLAGVISPPHQSVKEWLRGHLLAANPRGISPTYLVDADRWMREGEAKTALTLIKQWQTNWDRGDRSWQELEQESRLLHSVILGNPTRVTTAILDEADQVAGRRIQASGNDLEVLLVLTRERVEVGRSLVDVYRYRDAKRHLKQGYTALKLDSKNAVVAAREIFDEESKQILQKIQYADEVLHGAAKPIDEADFQAYLKVQKKNEQLTRNLQNLGNTPESEDPFEASGIDLRNEAVRKLALVGIQVNGSDLSASADNPAVIEVGKAHLVDRDDGNRLIAFTGKYHLENDALFDVRVQDEALPGSFLRQDLVRILLGQKEKMAPVSAGGDSLIPADLNEQDRERARILSRDLALSAVMRDLNHNGIVVDNVQEIVPINTDFTRFRVRKAKVAEAEESRKTVQVTFDYDLETQAISRLTAEKSDLTLEGPYAVGKVVQAIREALRSPPPKAAPEPEESHGFLPPFLGF